MLFCFNVKSLNTNKKKIKFFKDNKNRLDQFKKNLELKTNIFFVRKYGLHIPSNIFDWIKKKYPFLLKNKSSLTLGLALAQKELSILFLPTNIKKCSFCFVCFSSLFSQLFYLYFEKKLLIEVYHDKLYQDLKYLGLILKKIDYNNKNSSVDFLNKLYVTLLSFSKNIHNGITKKGELESLTFYKEMINFMEIYNLLIVNIELHRVHLVQDGLWYILSKIINGVNIVLIFIKSELTQGILSATKQLQERIFLLKPKVELCPNVFLNQNLTEEDFEFVNRILNIRVYIQNYIINNNSISNYDDFSLFEDLEKDLKRVLKIKNNKYINRKKFYDIVIDVYFIKTLHQELTEKKYFLEKIVNLMVIK